LGSGRNVQIDTTGDVWEDDSGDPLSPWYTYEGLTYDYTDLGDANTDVEDDDEPATVGEVTDAPGKLLETNS